MNKKNGSRSRVYTLQIVKFSIKAAETRAILSHNGSFLVSDARDNVLLALRLEAQNILLSTWKVTSSSIGKRTALAQETFLRQLQLSLITQSFFYSQR